MFGEYLFLIVIGAVLLMGTLSGVLAARKGYSFLIWFFAGASLGLIPLLALAFLKNFGDHPFPGEVNGTGNLIGGVLAVVGTLVMILQVVAAA